jgi:hypothetical protein
MGMKKWKYFKFIFIILLVTLSTVILISRVNDGKYKNFFKNENKVQAVYPGAPGFSWEKINLSWIRENMFINYNNYHLLGPGYSYNAYPNKKTIDNRIIKVLVFGDQYTWGFGNTDRLSTLGAILQEKLDSKYGENTFQIIINSNHSASTYNYFDYYAINSVKKIDPDLIVYNFFDDDIKPTFNETLICRSADREFCQNPDNKNIFTPKYQDCLYGHYDKTANLIVRFKYLSPMLTKKVLEGYCKPLLNYANKHPYVWMDVRQHPLDSPYIPIWDKAIKLLRSDLKGYQVGVARLVPGSPKWQYEDVLMGKLKSNNYDILPMNKTIKYFTGSGYTIEGKALTKINLGVGHPSAFINNIYTDDIIEYIESKIGKNKIKETKSLVKEYPSNDGIVVGQMPLLGVKVRNNSSGEARISFDPNKIANKEINAVGAP